MISELFGRLYEEEVKKIKMLYKYRYFDSDNLHLRSILLNEFYFATRNELNDPNDLSANFELEKAPIFQLLEYNNNLINNYSDLSQEEKQNYIRILTEEIILETPNYIKKLRYSMETVAAKVGICSFTAEHWDNIPMWAHYSQNHSGFCIGINNTKLYNYILENGLTKQLTPLIVIYTDEFPIFNQFDKDFFNIARFNQYRYKHSAWKYENEVRLSNNDTEIFNKTIIIPDDLIEEIILGYKISDPNKSIIIEALKLKTHKPKLYQIVPKENDFKFDRILIDY
ncbi:MAG: DUF2971 domain-containing protein [bacterium]